MVCPGDPSHGRVYDVGDKWFCPHADHDQGGRSKCLFTEQEVLDGHVIRQTVPVKRTRRARK